MLFYINEVHTRPLLIIRFDVFTVSPNKQYRGLLKPTTPATTGPEEQPTNNSKFSSPYSKSLVLSEELCVNLGQNRLFRVISSISNAIHAMCAELYSVFNGTPETSI